MVRRVVVVLALVVCGLVALLATLWLALILLTLAGAPDCIAKDGDALAAHWVVFVLTGAAVGALWVAAGRRLRGRTRAAAVLLLAVPVAVVVGIGIADVAATSWSGGDTEAAACM